VSVKFNLEKDKLLLLLVLTDMVFVILHILHIYTDLLSSSLYSLSRDRGYAEFFQYTKELWIVVLFFLLGIKQRRRLYFVFSLLFLYFLFDDSFEFHEASGGLLADLFFLQPVLGLRAVDIGELLVSALFGLLFSLSILLFYFLSDPIARRVAAYLVGMIVLLAGFGVLMDMVEIIVTHPEINRILVIIEEAGEMLVMSLIAWFTFRLNFNTDEIPLSWLPLKLPFDKRKIRKHPQP
jgi:hypothetical protein